MIGTLLAILSVLACAGAVWGIFAPQKALFWSSSMCRSRFKAVSAYLLLALVFAVTSKMAFDRDAQEGAVLPESAAAVNATGGVESSPAGNATQAPADAAQGPVNATRPAGQGLENKEQEKSTMDQAQESVTRAANATRDFFKNAAEEAGTIGGELIDGAKETGKRWYEGAKEAGKELVK